jgi:hypothetical protein
LKNYLLDANAICVVLPFGDVSDGEYLKPLPIILNSPSIIHYTPEHLLVAELNYDKKRLGNYDKTYLIVTADEAQTWVRKSDGLHFVKLIPHNLGELPAFKLQGAFFKMMDAEILFASRLRPMLPRLNDAAREYSDLQAEVVQHIHSEKWVWASDKCPKCMDGRGVPTGFVNDSNKKKVICSACNGSLLVPSSPYLNMVIRPSKTNMGESSAPIPPAGYITKPIDIVKIQDERIDKHLFKALASVNMQFLDATPLNVSGVAKEVDRDELNNFVYSVAEDLVRIMQRVYYFAIEYRYRIIMPDSEKRMALEPSIQVPQKFDLLSSNYLTAELDMVKKANVNPVIVMALEKEYASKKFYNDESVGNLVKLTLSLDPLGGVSEDDKMVRLTNGGISKLDYIISSNITALISEAVETIDDFAIKTSREQVALIEGLGKKLQAKIGALKVEVV